MSKRTDIIAALVARLKTISTTAPNTLGYQTNVGSSVFLWRVTAISPNEMPCLSVKYAIEPDTIDGEGLKGPKNIWNRSLPVGITAAVKGGTSLADVEKIVADVWKAIGTDDTFGGLVLTTNPDGDRITEDQNERLISGAIMTMKIEYRTNIYES